MKKALFIEKEGGIFQRSMAEDEPESLAFASKVIRNLCRIQDELGYALVIISPSPAESKIADTQSAMFSVLKSEGVVFEEFMTSGDDLDEIASTLHRAYQEILDSTHSFVVGGGKMTMQLARHLEARAVLISEETQADAALTAASWDDIFQYLRFPPRKAQVRRQTTETDVFVAVNLDGDGKAEIETGLGFFDHMLEQVARHSSCDLEIRVKGDLHIDEHHTIEDTALALGEAFAKALDNKKGIERYGFLLPMDDALAQVALDFSGRSWLVWKAEFRREKIGDMPTEMFYHFFKSFSDSAKCNLNIQASGENEHHKIESIFKATGRALKMAVKRDPENQSVPSTKGTL